MTVTRFAPSPTGLLHFGHAYAALVAHQAAKPHGKFFVRIEDIDTGRCRKDFEEAIFEDLAWLGLNWEEAVWRQSERLGEYASALAKLETLGVLYPCFCTRQEIAAAASAPQGPDGPVYGGICRLLSDEERARKIESGAGFATRLDVGKALAITGPLTWHDKVRGEVPAQPQLLGDAVLARKDIATSYHLAVTVDDAAQGITLVTRGEDLFSSTHLHRLLQALLGLPVPRWHHHRLICDASGRRLAKRDEARSLRSLRESGLNPEDVFSLLSLPH